MTVTCLASVVGWSGTVVGWLPIAGRFGNSCDIHVGQ